MILKPVINITILLWSIVSTTSLALEPSSGGTESGYTPTTIAAVTPTGEPVPNPEAILRSRFNRYFNSFPQNLPKTNNETFTPPSRDDKSRGHRGQELESTANNNYNYSKTFSGDSSSAATFIQSPANYIPKSSGEHGRERKNPIYRGKATHSGYKHSDASDFPKQTRPAGHFHSSNFQSQPSAESDLQATDDEDDNNNDDSGDRKPYHVAYAVKNMEGNHYFNREETSDGERVRGQYRVLLPDGRIQTVVYAADQVNGYNAVVTYKGLANMQQNLEQDSDSYILKELRNSQSVDINRLRYLPGLDNTATQGSSDSSGADEYLLQPTAQSSAEVPPPTYMIPILRYSKAVGPSASSPALAEPTLTQLPRYASHYGGHQIMYDTRHGGDTHLVSHYQELYQPPVSSPLRSFVPSVYTTRLLYGVHPRDFHSPQVTGGSSGKSPIQRITPVIPMETPPMTVFLSPHYGVAVPSLHLAPPPVALNDGPAYSLGSLPPAETTKAYPAGREIFRCSKGAGGWGFQVLGESGISRVLNQTSYSPLVGGNQISGVNASSGREETTTTEPLDSLKSDFILNVHTVPAESQHREGNGTESPTTVAAGPSVGTKRYAYSSRPASSRLTFKSDAEEMEHFLNIQLSKTPAPFSLAPTPRTTSRPETLAVKLRSELRAIKRKLNHKSSKNFKTLLRQDGRV